MAVFLKLPLFCCEPYYPPNSSCFSTRMSRSENYDRSEKLVPRDGKYWSIPSDKRCVLDGNSKICPKDYASLNCALAISDPEREWRVTTKCDKQPQRVP